MTGPTSFWDHNRTTVITGVVIVALLAALVGVRALGGGDDTLVVEAADTTGATANGDDSGPADGDTPNAAVRVDDDGADASAESDEGASDAPSTGAGSPSAASPSAAPTRAAGAVPPPPPVTTGTKLPGVTPEEIVVVYYWKGDRTRTSPYLHGTGTEGNVDEAEAFRKLVDYVNKYADGGGTIMGHPFNLHGRRIKPVVLEAGQDAEAYAATAQTIIEEVKPFAAVAAHGSISSYLCPVLAKERIHNFATYDLGGQLASSTNGYCTPGSASWERQVDVSQGWLLRQQADSPYNGPESLGVDAERTYGVIYTEYPGLVDSAPRMIERFKAAGLNIVAEATLNSSLATAQQQAPNVVGRMRSAGVNTIIMPDTGAPLNFTHASQAQGYSPDYYVWPCSGADTMAMVRLLNETQWARAEGLTCYDEQFMIELTHNAETRRSEWYAAYRDVAPSGGEPPLPTPLVYAGLLPLVIGVTAAGPELNLENFRAGLDAFEPYRYNGIEGRTDDASNMRLSMNLADRSLMSDFMYLKYEPTRQTSGNPAPGAYVFPDPRRYERGSEF